MATKRFLTIALNGLATLVSAIQSSGGIADADKIVATGADGRLDLTFMPVGIGPATELAVASENLSAGDIVSYWSNAGVKSVRKADASNGRHAQGFVLNSVTSGQNATVYTSGTITGLSSLTTGAFYFLSATGAGTVTTTAPTGTNQFNQVVGYATSANTIFFRPELPILIG